MEKFLMVTVGAVMLVLFLFVVYCLFSRKYSGKPVNKEFILEKIEHLYQNRNVFSKIKLYSKLIELRGLLEHQLRYYTKTEKNDSGQELSVIDYSQFPRKWQECVDYLWRIFDRRENGPYRDIDLKTLRDITQDVYELLKT